MAWLTCASRLSARPIWRTRPPCSPHSSRHGISRSINGRSTSASRGWSSSRNRRSIASRQQAPRTPMPQGVVTSSSTPGASSSSDAILKPGRSARRQARYGRAALARTTCGLAIGRSTDVMTKSPSPYSKTRSPTTVASPLRRSQARRNVVHRLGGHGEQYVIASCCTSFQLRIALHAHRGGACRYGAEGLGIVRGRSGPVVGDRVFEIRRGRLRHHVGGPADRQPHHARHGAAAVPRLPPGA